MKSLSLIFFWNLALFARLVVMAACNPEQRAFRQESQILEQMEGQWEVESVWYRYPTQTLELGADSLGQLSIDILDPMSRVNQVNHQLPGGFSTQFTYRVQRMRELDDWSAYDFSIVNSSETDHPLAWQGIFIIR
ncbi:MAG: hypothetical protein AAF804_05635, partial [Bacteroidota bacterium]